MSTDTEPLKTWAQIVEQRQRESHQREIEVQAWCAQVTERLLNETSKFLADFADAERRMLE